MHAGVLLRLELFFVVVETRLFFFRTGLEYWLLGISGLDLRKKGSEAREQLGRHATSFSIALSIEQIHWPNDEVQEVVAK